MTRPRHGLALKGLFRALNTLDPLNNDEFIGTDVPADGPPFAVGRALDGPLGRPAIDNHRESGPASKGKREEVVQVRVSSGNDDPVARHTV
jgi:hypothetical protein